MFWYILLHWVHDSLRGLAKRHDSTFLLLPFIIGGGTCGTGICLYLYYGLKKAATGSFFIPWFLG